ncbi:hypothetical protein [Hippea alviniae]|uniref:hypothetical protein n=1 Tax=Hippea alviniae TaxID=1279027 RepID=UPI0003B69E45|nr:hypothetical protein [Hippea alviniae]
MKDVYLIIGFLQIVLVIFMQWQVYLKKIIMTFAISSISIAFFLFANGVYLNNTSLLVLAFLTIAVRGLFIPGYMLKKLNSYYKDREPKHVIPTAASIIISLLLVIVAYVLYNFTLYDITYAKAGSIPIALILQGIFLIISRNNAFVQLIGYMVMENSLFLFAGYMFPELPLIIEGGILLDLIGIVMISGIIMRLRENYVSDISEEFEEFKG